MMVDKDTRINEAFVTAEELAKGQREISVAEFFEKNRHLLGFDNPQKALLTVVREAVDNSLDACEEARILPEVIIKVKQIKEDRYIVIIQDNGPGIVKEQIPRIFGKLLYGSKFYKLSQSRGQQGIGISAAVLYSQLTTGKPVLIRSRTDAKKKIHEFELRIDTMKNEPQIIREGIYDGSFPDHGTYIEMEVEGAYKKGKQSIDEYVKQTALANPFSKLVYKSPEDPQTTYSRVVDELPPRARSIKPHPHGVEMGVFERMSKNSKARSISAFLSTDFSRVSSANAKTICKTSKIDPGRKADSLNHEEVEKLWRTIQATNLMKPPLDCLSPIGEQVLETAIKKDLKCEFVAAITRPTSVYRGNPFGIEVCIGYGGEIEPEGPARIVRVANRVPLIYEASACAVTKALKTITWNGYRVQQQNNMPQGPIVFMIHMYSTWIPYTSEGKEAIDAYPIILKEIKLALQDCLRRLARYLSGKHRRQIEKQRQSLFERYIPELANTLEELTEVKKEEIIKDLNKMLKKELLEDATVQEGSKTGDN